MPKSKIFEGYWTVNDARSNKNSLFVYGDNDIKKGKKGQAIIRDEPNAIGIPTKKYPSLYNHSFYTDTEIELNKKKIDNAIDLLLEKSANYDYVVFPKDGLGTGLAKMDTKAPKTFAYLNGRIGEFILKYL